MKIIQLGFCVVLHGEDQVAHHRFCYMIYVMDQSTKFSAFLKAINWDWFGLWKI